VYTYKHIIVVILINALVHANCGIAFAEPVKSQHVTDTPSMLSPHLTITSVHMEKAAYMLFRSYIPSTQRKIEPDYVDLLKKQAQGSGGLLHLEQSYNSSRTLMRGISIFSGSLLGAMFGLSFFPNLPLMLASVIVGGALFGIIYSIAFPQSDYQSAEQGLNILENATNDDHLKAAYELFENAQSSELVTVQRIGITGARAIEQLLEKARAQQTVNLDLEDTQLSVQKDVLEKLKINIKSLGLGELFSIIEDDQRLYLSVSSDIPTENHRKLLRKAISGNDIFDTLFDGISLTDTEKTLIQERFWHGIFDLLYRQDQNTAFTPEYITLYKDGVIFKDPGVLRCLALDTKRSQEDFMVDALKKSHEEKNKNLNFLVFATGSGVLVNNILQNMPSVEKLIEYDRSQNSNDTANKRRKQTIAPPLYKKVQQVTADVRDFDTTLAGEKFDAVLSTASLRLMSNDARESVIDYLRKQKALKKSGSFYYMDTQEHSLIIETAASQLRGSGFDVAISKKDFAGHRDAMFYIFVHQYRRNYSFKAYIDKLMAIKQSTDLYGFLYTMAGHRKIKFLLLSAQQKTEHWQKKQFAAFVQNLKPLVYDSFKKAISDFYIRIEKGPSSKVTLSLLGKDATKESLDSYDVFIDAPQGQVAMFTLYDGRSIGMNTLISGRLSFEDPTKAQDRVLLNQHILTSRYGYEEAATNLKNALEKLLPENIDLNNEDILEKFSHACVGLTAPEISRTIAQETDTSLENLFSVLHAHPRTKYPSQEAASFPKAAGVIRALSKGITAHAEHAGYASLTGLISLPDGLQNLIMYKKFMGFSPVVTPENKDYFETIESVLSKKGLSLKDKAWELSKKLKQLLVLIQKDITPHFPQEITAEQVTSALPEQPFPNIEQSNKKILSGELIFSSI